MKCAECKQDGLELTEGQFTPDGMVPGISMVSHAFKCKECVLKPDREPGCDDDLEIPATDW